MAQSNKSAALRRMAGGLAHELNNLFTAISGNLQLIEYKPLPREMVLEIVADVLRATARGVALAQKLQAYSGHQELRPELFDLGAMVLEVSRLPLLEGLDVSLSLPPDPYLVFFDRARIYGLLTEIAANARAATKAGDSIVWAMQVVDAVDPDADGAAPGVRLSLCDSGRGMTPEVLRNALDPMFTTKPPRGNTGWGLSLAEGLVLQLGGNLTLASRRGGGTCVEIYLPTPIFMPRRT